MTRSIAMSYETFEVIVEALRRQAPIDLIWELPQLNRRGRVTSLESLGSTQIDVTSHYDPHPRYMKGVHRGWRAVIDDVDSITVKALWKTFCDGGTQNVIEFEQRQAGHRMRWSFHIAAVELLGTDFGVRRISLGLVDALDFPHSTSRTTTARSVSTVDVDRIIDRRRALAIGGFSEDES